MIEFQPYSSAITIADAQDPQCTAEEKEFIKNKINGGQWLIDSIEQRRSTLTRVSQAIVKHQKSFLTKVPESIEPLKMQQIADKVGVHVTTVSRAVDDKWMQTPRGILPLKRFLWEALRTKMGKMLHGIPFESSYKISLIRRTRVILIAMRKLLTN